MSLGPENLDALSPLKRALLALTDMQARLDAAQRVQNEPIAIIGMGCRFPGGAGNPQAFWRMLQDGADGISEVPPDRWNIDTYYDPDPAAPGKMNTRWGGFLGQVDQFDAAFFGISKREALWMDPQQRLLLEVAWEALEDSGQTAGHWSERPAGVFIGVSSSDYVWHQLSGSGELEAYTSTGNSYSIVANRLSYLLDLKGPSLVVDTACSSSLVAVHLACQSLRNQECHLALAGGVNLVLSPMGTISLSKYGMMAPDGHCKAFDAAADGFVRGEGCGVVVLKRLSDALVAGDPILALIRGAAVNQDGRSNGLTAPNMRSQQEVIRQALAHAGVAPEELQYIEAHGTGTPLGDPIETEALKAVLASTHVGGHECLLGSVKANLGHLEAAAGIAGLIKVVLSLQHEAIPPQVHFHVLNPHINLAHSPLVIAPAGRPWRRGARPRFAGVSSFGFGGTNAHAVLEEAPERPQEPGAAQLDGRAYLLPLSARSPHALTALSRSYQDFLQGEPLLHDVCYTASVRRNHHAHRLAVLGRSPAELAERLKDLTPMGPTSAVPLAGVVFVFGGQGEQWPGMGRELLAQEPVFREAVESCETLLRQYVDWSLTAELLAENTQSRLIETHIAQPVLLALQIGLASLWRSWGIEPAAVVGHSAGEIAAAYVAGILGLEDAVRVAVHRGRLMQAVQGQGRMLAVEMSPEDAQRVLDSHPGVVSIAAFNGPSATVLSGDAAALESIARAFQQQGIGYRELQAPYAFHGPHLAPLAAGLEQSLQGLRVEPAILPIVSTLTGRLGGAGDFEPRYWGRQLCEPVRFADAMTVLADRGHEVFLELSPHPVLGGAMMQCLSGRKRNGVVLASLRRNRAEREALLTGLSRLYTLGYSVAWDRLYGNAGRCIPLPAYPWQHERFWPADTGSRAGAGPKRANAHPLLGEFLPQAANSGLHCWQASLDRVSCSYLNDHRVQGAMILPAAAYVEMALAAGAEALGAGPHALEEIAFLKALFLPEDAPQTVQVVISTADSGGAGFKIFSRHGTAWLLHATGTIAGGNAGSLHSSVEQIRSRCPEAIDRTEHYEAMQNQGLEYGPSFQGVQQIWRRDGEALGRLQLPHAAAPGASAYHLHPALLDAGFQLLAAAVPREQIDFAAGDIYLPVKMGSLRSYARLHAGAELWGHVVVRSGPESAADAFEGDLFLMDADGHVAVEALGLRLQRLDSGTRSEAGDRTSRWLYEIQWQPKELPQPVPSLDQNGRWLLLADRGGVGRELEALLRARGEHCVTILTGDLDVSRPEEFRRLLREAFGIGPPRGVIHLWSLDAAPSESTTLASLEAAQEWGCGSALHLVQALGQTAWQHFPRLWLITRGAHSLGTGSAPISFAQAPLLGLGRVIALEHPELRCTEVDLSPESSAEEIVALVEELTSEDVETQVALRGGTRYGARLVRWSPESPLDTQRLVPAADQPFRLETGKPGVLDHLCLRASIRRPPGPGEVEIRVAAAALNFNDVLKALGLYPDLPAGPVPLGSECAGTIVALGPGVEGLAVGDEVVALAEGSFGSLATTRAPMVAAKSAHLTMDEAATLPVVFMTAVYALRHLGQLASGDRVLIHAAAGGVGLAAVQVAQQAGAEIFATAGSPEKRAFLASLGVRHVMDSRSLAFADDVMALTGGRGVDVVLNSLAGDGMLKSLGLMAPYGRFLELGKRDLYENRQVGLWPFRKGVSYLPVDLAGLVQERPAQFNDLWREVMQDVAAGVWQPLPHQVFPIGEAVNAFREMAQGKHIGKIVLSLEDESATLIAPAAAAPFALPELGTYLITGGLGGLGLQVARWMVKRGARHLVLIGRRGASESAREMLNSLEQTGAKIVVVSADVSSADQMAEALAQIDRDLPPLRGIIHAAGVLDDGLLLQQNWQRFTNVMSPKVLGAWNLHTLTLDAPLDFFVMFSSMAAVVGSPGQGNYAAANAFLDGLAGFRRAQGLPALSINWGPWSEVGMAAAQQDQRGMRERNRQWPVGTIAPRAGLQLLEQILSQPLSQIGVMPVNWRQFQFSGATPSLLADLVREANRDPSAAGLGDEASLFREALRAAAAEERQGMLETYLSQQLAHVLGSPASALDVSQPLSNLGMDSLMAVELRNRIQTGLGVILPTAHFLQGPSLQQMSTLLLEQLTTQWLVEAPRGTNAESASEEWEVLTV